MGDAYEAVDERDPAVAMMEKEDGVPLSEYISRKMMFAAMEWAVEYPERFKTIKLKSRCPELTHAELARRRGVSRRTVINHLEPINLKIKE
ncbi:MAG: hypothetical protein NT118_03250 [Lentisphaerae bacterium]|nr:hypothetical protein [Lentisphaerota bacterium]